MEKKNTKKILVHYNNGPKDFFLFPMRRDGLRYNYFHSVEWQLKKVQFYNGFLSLG